MMRLCGHTGEDSASCGSQRSDLRPAADPEVRAPRSGDRDCDFELIPAHACGFICNCTPQLHKNA